MPKAERQRPVSVATSHPVSDGTVLSEAFDIGQLEDSFVKMLVYGTNGVGKSTLACDFPKPLLLLALEPGLTGGARSVRKVPGVKYLHLKPDRVQKRDGSWETTESITAKLFRLADELKASNPFATVVVDSVTSLQEIVLQEILGLDTLPAQLNFGTISGDSYRTRAERTKEALRPWVDLPCHTVFIGKEKDHNPPKEERVNEKTGKVQPDMRARFIRGLQQESFVTVDLGGGTASWLQDGCDYIGRLYFDREMLRQRVGATEIVSETGKFIRCLRIGYHPNFAARFRSDTPAELPEAIEQPTWLKIQAAIQGKKVN